MIIGEWLRKIGYLLSRNQHAAELDEEMRLHVELRARKLTAGGVPAGEAPHAARR